MQEGGHGVQLRKKRRGDRAFRFRNFCHPGYPTSFDGPFRRNLQALLQYAQVEPDCSLNLKTWSFRLELFHHPQLCVSLFIVEEPIEKSLHLNCHHCRSVGWGHHMICNRKFHFVLPSKETRRTMEGRFSGEGGCSGEHVAQKPSLVELEGHLMHGLFHANGFGHLLQINGMEMGSDFITGSQIMDLWDRICSGLRARKVSITDTAKKRGMDLRVVHGVAYGEPWFGRWGYRLERGTYGVTQQMHHKAIESLGGMPVCLLIQRFSACPDVLAVVARYQTMSGFSLPTLGHLCRFMLELKLRLPLESPASLGPRPETACRWSSKRVEMATRVIIESLKKADSKWVSRQEVRDAARVSIGDTGLLDFVLKSLSNHVVGNYMVRRAVNPVTKVLEYCLEDVSTLFPIQDAYPITDANTRSGYQVINRTQLMKDFFCIYRYVLVECRQGLNVAAAFTGIPAAVRIILDGKHLVKDYKGESLPRQTGAAMDENLNLWCTIRIANQEERRGNGSQPHELVVVPVHATMGELKAEVERCFRELYWCLKTFVAECMVDVKGEDSDLVYALIESGRSIVTAGRIAEEIKDKEVVYEGGDDNWVVDCHCGAKDDDGEQMISCYICEAWQHIRCVQVADDVPQIFLCSRCESNIVAFPSLF